MCVGGVGGAFRSGVGWQAVALDDRLYLYCAFPLRVNCVMIPSCLLISPLKSPNPFGSDKWAEVAVVTRWGGFEIHRAVSNFPSPAPRRHKAAFKAA